MLTSYCVTQNVCVFVTFTFLQQCCYDSLVLYGVE